VTSPRATRTAGALVLALTAGLQIAQAAPASADTVAVNVDGTTLGGTYQGVGAVFSNGMTKLLMDYPAAQRQAILDLLFSPKYGASLQHLKIEIGSDANTSAGTEPSHTRSATDLDVTRGASLWLAQQAKLRNPALTVDALRWGTPAYVDTDAERYQYYKTFLDGAKSQYGLDFDYLGAERNEHTSSSDWAPTGASRNFVVNTLRPGLDADGYADVSLTAADSNTGWWIADRVAADPDLKDALGALTVHYRQDSTSTARGLGLPLWNGEDLAPFRGDWLTGPLDMANRIIRTYAVGRMTLYEMHPAIEAGYPNTPFNFKSIMTAQEPWSGHYTVESGLWTTAHFTQFTQPGWRYVDSATTSDGRGGTLTVKDPASANWSMVLLNTGATPRTFTVSLSNGIAASTLRHWRSTATAAFVQQTDVTVAGGSFSVTLPPYAISSLTTTSGQQKGSPANPAAAPFALPYTDAFDTYAVGDMPKYSSDQGGAFEVAADGANKVLAQVITAATKPVDWKYRPTPEPYTLLGSLDWRNYEAEVRGRLPDGTGYLLLGGRINHTAKSAAPADGYDLKVDADGAWTVRAGANPIASGTVAGFAVTAWHGLKLRFNGTSLQAYIDGLMVADLTHTSFASGQIVLGSGYHRADFDDLAIRPITLSPQSVTRYADNDGRLRYTGTWVTEDGNYDTFTRTTSMSRHAGDTMEFSFNGTTTSIVGTRDVDGGQADVYVDGVLSGTLDTYAATRQYRRAIYQVPAAAAGNHTVRLTVKGTKQAASLDTLVRVDAVETIGGTGLLTPAAAAPPRTVVHDTFDAYPDGTLGQEFRVAPDVQKLDWLEGSPCAVVSVPSATDKSFACADTSTTASAETSREFPRTGSGLVTVAFRFQQTAVGAWTRMFVSSGPDTAIQLYDTPTGLAFLDGAGTYHPLVAISANTWYDVRLVIDTSARTFDAYLNNSVVLNGESYTDPAVTDISSIQLRTGTAPTTTLRVDFLSVKVG
jgi:galactosylceramidase